MKRLTALRLAAVSLVLALAGRYAFLDAQSWQNARLTSEMCAAVGNYLETGSLRGAFEGLQFGLARHGEPGACVSIVDNGRSYAPDCVDSAKVYQTTVCKAEANKGVRAQILYPVGSLFETDLLFAWLTVFGGLLLSFLVAQAVASYFAGRATEELRARLLHDLPNQSQRGWISQVVDWILERTGVLRDLKKKTSELEEKLRSFQAEAHREAALRAQKEAEISKSREYVDKIRKIRHDIRSPLSSLLAVQEAIDPADDLIHSSLTTATRSISSLLDRLSNVESEELAPRLAIVEVIAEEVVVALGLKFERRKGVSLTLSYNSEYLSPVLVVPDGLRRIFENLLENAFDAVSQRGSITMTVHQDHRECRIEIEDDGCGIPADLIPRLFREGATFGKVNGTGLGLFQAKKNLQAWKGEIECKPLTQGTRFVIRLPLAQTGAVFQGRPRGDKLVVVDDDPLVVQSLRRNGFDVVDVAASFAEGKTLLESRRPRDATILVDHYLGQGELGTDLLAGVTGRKDMFLCTNDFDSPEVVRKAKETGTRIIPKPLMILGGPKTAVPFPAAH